MVRSIAAFAGFLMLAVIAQDRREPTKVYDVKRCTPNVERHQPLPKDLTLVAQKGEKATGYSPLVSFQILESGNVANARLKRSSGFAKIDNYAQEWIRETKYNARPACGVVDRTADVLIHWTSGE
jgi:TonB family protein